MQEFIFEKSPGTEAIRSKAFIYNQCLKKVDFLAAFKSPFKSSVRTLIDINILLIGRIPKACFALIRSVRHIPKSFQSLLNRFQPEELRLFAAQNLSSC